jgi:hypothetical protein
MACPLALQVEVCLCMTISYRLLFELVEYLRSNLWVASVACNAFDVLMHMHWLPQGTV